MKHLLSIVLLFITLSLQAQDMVLEGTISAAENKQPIQTASIRIKDKLTGTTSDENGRFRLQLGKIKLPVTLVISSVGFEEKEWLIKDAGTALSIELERKSTLLNEVVTAASRVQENILSSPVTIEKMNQRSIRENPSLSFYDGLQHIKGMEVVTSSLTYKQVNTRGFNSTGNSRFLQLIDGVDNQTPGLNFAVGNQFGASDLDIDDVEIIPGSASALYGPMAFNGALLMHTKDPFKYQGLSMQAKTGINHIGEDAVGIHGLYDLAARYAKAFNNKFAFKLNISYLSGLDWYATDYTDVSAQTPPPQRGPNNPGRDALNIYGDEVSRTLEGIGLVSRTGYEEKDLMNYNVYSLKLNGALHYRITNNLEAIYQYNVGKGTASYTGSSRFDLNNFVLQTHRVELRGSQFYIRGYVVSENSHDSYNTRSLGQFINRSWVRDLNGNPVQPNQADDMWFNRYEAAYTGTINGVTANNHPAARAFADQGRFTPGSEQFETAKDASIHNYGLSGAGVFSNSKFYHAEGQYDFSKAVKFIDLLAGANFRYYDMFTNGSLFQDKDQKITISEWGGFVQAGKKLLEDKLKLTASLRYDKNENFDGYFTPRIAAVFTAAKTHNFRASFQTGFRNPTPVDQYIHLNVGPITILGGVPNNSKGLPAYTNSFTAASVGAFGAAFGAAMQNGTPFPEAVNNSKGLLVKSNVPYIKPEKQRAFEVGYKGLFHNQLLVDLNYNYSSYTNFILNTVVIAPENQVIGEDGSPNFDAAADILNGDVRAFQLYTNAADKVSAQSISAGLTYMAQKGYQLGGNITWASFNLLDANPNNVPAFNTPKYSANMTFGNPSVYRNYGFQLSWHWQDAFDWYGTFNGMRPGRINAYSLVDLQFNKKLPSVNGIIKLGGSNIFNNQIYQSYGSPRIGAIYYVSFTFDGLLK
ncbi:TonB-dependent receptor [Flavihumibacter sp. CACIAM 22H1]|uniref:TonB-dependent receptor n=1 Tax=Flavihumibacter sp. CACIAM 22H1 TaxID=1812911 RepID=UPI0007A8E4E6|nr:TonB-dependent receptor [Flavihumibacter sp. CACIAM 22H1]KYP14159.1 MAG: TonB-dependent receptor [Flavihumibacter sp. CACIAM 22H1]